jgi:hypothetical protein
MVPRTAAPVTGIVAVFPGDDMDESVGPFNQRPRGSGSYVLYWMQQAQRSEDNPALEHALAAANRRGLAGLRR